MNLKDAISMNSSLKFHLRCKVGLFGTVWKKTNSYRIKLVKGQWDVDIIIIIFFLNHMDTSIYWIRSDIGQYSDTGEKCVPIRFKVTA